jgi:hypothetical protein
MPEDQDELAVFFVSASHPFGMTRFEPHRAPKQSDVEVGQRRCEGLDDTVE